MAAQIAVSAQHFPENFPFGSTVKLPLPASYLNDLCKEKFHS